MCKTYRTQVLLFANRTSHAFAMTSNELERPSCSLLHYVLVFGARCKQEIQHVPGAMTSSSQKFMWSVILNWTMTYLKGGRLYGQYRETVAPAGTAPGY